MRLKHSTVDTLGSDEGHIVLIVHILVTWSLILNVLNIARLLIKQLIIERDITRFTNHIRAAFVVNIPTLDRLLIDIGHVWDRRSCLLKLSSMLAHKAWSLSCFITKLDDVIRDVML